MRNRIDLTPAQQIAARGLLEHIVTGGVLVLRGKPGTGKTTILEAIHEQRGGLLRTAREIIGNARPDVFEEAFLRMIYDAIQMQDLVLIDDLQVVTAAVDRQADPGGYLFDASLTAILAEAQAMKTTLVFASRTPAPWSIRRRARVYEIGADEPHAVAD